MKTTLPVISEIETSTLFSVLIVISPFVGFGYTEILFGSNCVLLKVVTTPNFLISEPPKAPPSIPEIKAPSAKI